MDKGLITKINADMAKLSKKIELHEAALAEFRNKREKFQEVLDMLAPKKEVPVPEPSVFGTESAQTLISEPRAADGISEYSLPHFLKKHPAEGEVS